MKKVLLINGDSDAKSFCWALADAYEDGAREAGIEIARVNIGELKFDPILHNGYREIQALEPDLTKTQEQIKWAEHIVFVSPTWWAGMPALMKGFIDRTFLPGFGFRYRQNSPLWDKLLAGRSARVITTSGSPKWYGRLKYFGNMHRNFTFGILKFCGIKPVKTTIFDSIGSSTDAQRQTYLSQTKTLGKTNK
jgi:NAD(P)H dehydrogenase (quinone)